MRTFEHVLPVFRSLGRALDKYSRIDRMPFDFGVGEPLFPSEIHMLATVVDREPVCVTNLAHEMGVTKGAVSQLVGRLRNKGLVCKDKDRLNGARVVVSATDLGRVAYAKHMEFHKRHDAEFLEFLGEPG